MSALKLGALAGTLGSWHGGNGARQSNRHWGIAPPHLAACGLDGTGG